MSCCRVMINFAPDCQWIGKIREVEGSRALIHFDGWKPHHDQWVPRKNLCELPPPEMLSMAKVVHGKILTKEEQDKIAK
jgi:hypothetical protein